MVYCRLTNAPKTLPAVELTAEKTGKHLGKHFRENAWVNNWVNKFASRILNFQDNYITQNRKNQRF